jgi:hypothetical protein
MEGLPEIGMLTRDVLESCDDYDCVIDMFSTTRSIVPIFVILAGKENN